MILSMTGFGRAEGMVNGRQIVIEIKSLNGKQFDLNHRFPALIRPYEVIIRQTLIKSLNRGTVDCSISIKQDGSSKPMQVNTQLAQSYIEAVEGIAHALKLNWEEEKKKILPAILSLPEVVAPVSDSLPEEDWKEVYALLQIAIQNLIEYRKQEGAPILEDIAQRVNHILEILKEIEPLEIKRLDKIKNRIYGTLGEWIDKEKIDENRFEQELLFYIEKIDISEEKQRLTAHCEYFKSIINEDNSGGIGKKLGFVTQEIGREINTLGSKANDAEIQRLVVGMKDDLEKIKEQILNIL